MSSMADQMAARLNEDGGQGLAHPDPGTGQGAGGVPGNEGGAPPAAEPSTTDTGAQGGGQPPETIPYARFKEVNDRYSALKGFEQLASYGYDSDSLGRLAAFEAQYQSDPIGTWKAMASNLDLPQELLDAIERHSSGAATAPSPESAQAQPSGDKPTTTELPPDVKERLAYVDQLREREAVQAREAQLARVEAAWDAQDKEEGIETPRMVKLMAIRSLADGDQTYNTVGDFVRAARAPVMDYRNQTLGSAVRNRQTGITPSLPGSPPVPTEPVNFGGDIKAATKAAQAAIERGEIPS